MLKEIVYSEKEMEGYMRKCNKCHGKSNVFPKSVPIFYNIDDDYYKIVVRNLLSYKFEMIKCMNTTNRARQLKSIINNKST